MKTRRESHLHTPLCGHTDELVCGVAVSGGCNFHFDRSHSADPFAVLRRGASCCPQRLLRGGHLTFACSTRGSITRPQRPLYALRSSGRPIPGKTRFWLVTIPPPAGVCSRSGSIPADRAQCAARFARPPTEHGANKVRSRRARVVRNRAAQPARNRSRLVGERGSQQIFRNHQGFATTRSPPRDCARLRPRETSQHPGRSVRVRRHSRVAWLISLRIHRRSSWLRFARQGSRWRRT